MKDWRVWAGRLLILIVLAWNVQCALAFLIQPGLYAPAFELSGAPGEGMLRGLGVLFLMWNVPYAVALLHPLRRRVSLYEALAMQTIGLLGETLLLLTFPAGHAQMHSAVGRFVAFDAAGLVLLLAAWWVTRRFNHTHRY